MRSCGLVLRIVLVLVLSFFALPGSARAGTDAACFGQETFPQVDSGVSPQHIVAGPASDPAGQRLYFTGTNLNFIGRMRLDGRQDFAYTDNMGVNPHRIVLGPDQNVWWTESLSNSVRRLNIAQQLIDRVVLNVGTFPTGITVAKTSGGAADLWVANRDSADLVEILPSGALGMRHPLAVTGPADLEMDPTGTYVFFTAPGSDAVGRINIVTGAETDYDGASIGFLDRPKGITAAANGSMYFTELCGDRIIRIDPATGRLGVVKVLAPSSGPADIVAVGNVLWFTEQRASKIGKITLSSTEPEFPLAFKEIPTPTPGSSPKGINAAPDGTIWFTEGKSDANRKSHVGRINALDQITEFVVCSNPSPTTGCP